MATKRPTEVYTESNPNPNSLKFVINYDLLPPGSSVEYASKEEAKDSKFAEQLFDSAPIDRVFITSNFITLNKKEEAEWEELAPSLRPLIKSILEKGENVVDNEIQEEEVVQAKGDQLEDRIKVVLDEYIKPAVEMDGGAIVFKSFEEGTLKVQLKGSCSGCPSSTLTLKSGIENLMKRMVPEVELVEAEDA